MGDGEGGEGREGTSSTCLQVKAVKVVSNEFSGDSAKSFPEVAGVVGELFGVNTL